MIKVRVAFVTGMMHIKISIGFSFANLK